jgi:hypothetical protein
VSSAESSEDEAPAISQPVNARSFGLQSAPVAVVPEEHTVREEVQRLEKERRKQVDTMRKVQLYAHMQFMLLEMGKSPNKRFGSKPSHSR